MMKISNELRNQAIELSKEFEKIHNEYGELDRRLHELSTKRDSLLERLNHLRSIESELINKIEEQSGSKFTADLANELIYEES